MFRLLDAFLSAGDGKRFAAVGDARDADLSGGDLLELFQLLALLAKDPAVMLFRDCHLFAGLVTMKQTYRYGFN